MAIELVGNKKGGGLTQADFSSSGRLRVDSENNLTAHHVSLDDGLAFNVTSIIPTIAAGAYGLYFKNTSKTRNFFVDLMRVSSGTASLWKVVTVTGTATGTTLTATNINLSSGISPEATIVGNGAVGGLTEDKVITVARNGASVVTPIAFDDTLILGTDDAIAVERDIGTSGEAEVFLRGYFR